MVKIQLETGYLNVKEGTVFPLNLGVADIRDVSKRSGIFSKSITLVGDDNNNQLLNHYYDVNIEAGTFDINTLTKCAVIQNGLPILEDCYLQLVSVNKSQADNGYEEKVEYTVVIKDAQADFFTKLDNKELTDLDLTDLNHTYSAANVVTSFSHDYTDGYMYPLTWSPNNDLQLTDFKPAVYAKTYWDRIHSNAGFSYEWSTMSDAFFDKCIIPYNGDEPELDYEEYLVEAEKNSFTATLGSTITSWTEITDDQALFNPTTGVYNPPFYIGTGQAVNAHVTFSGTIALNNTSGANAYLRSTTNATGFTGLRYNVQVMAYRGSVLVGVGEVGFGEFATSSNPLPNGSTTLATINSQIDIPVNATVPTDDITFQINIFYEVLSGGLPLQTAWYDASVGGSAVTVSPVVSVTGLNVQINASSNTLSFGQTMPMNEFIPRKIKQKDFVKSICTMYNLYVEPDKDNPNKLIYKHRDDYYDGGSVKNWTTKLAKERQQDLAFLPDLSAKKLVLSYKQDNDSWNQSYEFATNEIYGQVEYTFGNEYVKGEDRKELIFSPTPTAWNSFGAVIPLMIGAAPKNNIRILIHNGTKTCGAFNIYNYTNSGSTGLTSYPMVSHFDDHFNPSFDINFAPCDYYFYTPIFALTNNNLFNLYWRRTVGQIEEGKMLTAYFDLTEGDIQTVSLSDKIRIDNSYWHINRIIDYDANSNGLTKVELLSVDTEIDLPPFRRKTKIVKNPASVLNANPNAAQRYYDVNNVNYSGDSVIIKGVGNNVSAGLKGMIIGDNKVLTEDKSIVDLGKTPSIQTEILEIGSWDMDATAAFYIPFSLQTIVSYDIVIYADNGDIEPFYVGGSSSYDSSAEQFVLVRDAGGAFDNSAHDDTTINRGYVTIHYIS